jgi:signal recognition particle subunit SEC65
MAMLLLGAISLEVSICCNSTILAFIGLGVVFWGAVLLYIKPEEYTRKALLEAVSSPSLITLNQMIQELGYKGNATYLPPKYFTDPEKAKIYIPKQKSATLPTPEQIQIYEKQPVARTTQGILLTPPGVQLSKLLEKSLGTSFIKTDLRSLEERLPKLFIEDLEVAENLEIQAQDSPTERKKDYPASATQRKNTTIRAKITKPIIGNMLKDAEGSSQRAGSIISPVCSAIAIALTKASGKPVRIADIKSSDDGNVVEATYEVIED